MLKRLLLALSTMAMLVAMPTPASAEWWDIIWEMSGPRMLGFGYTCKPLGPLPFAGKEDGSVPILTSTGRVIETVAAHGLFPGDKVDIQDHTNAALNGVQIEVVEVLSPTRFAVNVNVGAGTGAEGEVALSEPPDGERGLAESNLLVTVSRDKCLFISNKVAPSPGDDSKAHYWLRTGITGYVSIKHPADPDGDNRPRVWAVAPELMFEFSGVHPVRGARVVGFAGVGVQMFSLFGDGFRPIHRPAIKFRTAAVRINRVLGVKALEVALDFRWFPTAFLDDDFLPAAQRTGASAPTQGKGEWVTGTFITVVL